MKRIGLTFALVAALAVPATAAAQDRPDRENAGRHCKALRGDEVDVLRRAFGTGHLRAARRRCRSERARLKGRLLVRAIRECRAERAQDPAAFEEKYAPIEAARDEAGEDRGEGRSEDTGEGRDEGRDERRLTAFVRCVRQKYRELREEFANAAEECKAERAEDRVAFRQKYGTNRNRRNALGKCVSEHVRAEEGEPEDAPESEDAPGRSETQPERPDHGRGRGPREL
jgi:hypothetical protein